MTHQPRIIVVDDDESIRVSLKKLLEYAGFIVDVAETGVEAIEKAQNTFYNLAIIDYQLPDCLGTQLLTKFKKYMPKTRKIFLTGYPTLENAIEALNCQADVYLIKPVSIEKMLNTIREELKIQEDEKRSGELKLAVFIESKANELNSISSNLLRPRRAPATRVK